MNNIPQQTMPHNGNLLKQIMAETRFTQADLARGLGTNQTAIIRHIAKYTIKTQDLWKLSMTLGNKYA